VIWRAIIPPSAPRRLPASRQKHPRPRLRFYRAQAGAVRIGYGVDRWYYCDYTARAVANLAVVTGNIGVAGGGISVHDGTYGAPLNLRPFPLAGRPRSRHPRYYFTHESDRARRSLSG